MTNSAEERSFGFVAGREQNQFSGIDMTTAVDGIVESVAILLDWRKRAAFRCVAEVRHEVQSYEYDVIARPRELSYEVVDKRSGQRDFFDPVTGELHEGNSQRPIDASQLYWEHMAVRLAFPVSLGVWGRPGDGYRMTGTDRGEGELIVALAHQKDPSLTGTLTIDLARRTAVRLDTPTLGIEYRDIQPA